MQYDILVIGAGPAGYVAAIRAAQLGRKVAVVERADLGGVCLNWGCIPTKALLKSAQTFDYCRQASHYGVEIEGGAESVKPNIEAMVARSRSVAEAMGRGVEFLLKKGNIETIRGTARLISKGEIEVEGVRHTAQSIILATGARAREIEALPIDGERIISSRHALALTKIPESIIVVGSGAIGSEFAWLYATLGSKVTIVEAAQSLMPLEDEEVSKTMERTFRKLKVGVRVATAVKGSRIADNGQCVVTLDSRKGEEELMADVVLSAVGIKSNIENLGLEELGIEVERDKIVVDDAYQTSVEGIYAVGDIISTPALAHVASAEAIRCVELICGEESKAIDYNSIPSCVYTSPEVASVGLTEAAAAEKGLLHRVGRFPFSASGRAKAAGATDGFVKLLFDSEDRLIGAHMVGMNVTEMLSEVTLASQVGATASEIARTIHAHPTMSEAIMEAAEEHPIHI